MCICLLYVLLLLFEKCRLLMSMMLLLVVYRPSTHLSTNGCHASRCWHYLVIELESAVYKLGAGARLLRTAMLTLAGGFPARWATIPCACSPASSSASRRICAIRVRLTSYPITRSMALLQKLAYVSMFPYNCQLTPPQRHAAHTSESGNSMRVARGEPEGNRCLRGAAALVAHLPPTRLVGLGRRLSDLRDGASASAHVRHASARIAAVLSPDVAGLHRRR